MLPMDIYVPFIVIIGVVTAAITGARLAFVMGKSWKLRNTPLGWTCFGSAVASAVVVGVMCGGAINAYGLLAGLLVNFVSLPMVGFVWCFIVGGNKVLERILGTLLNKFTD